MVFHESQSNGTGKRKSSVNLSNYTYVNMALEFDTGSDHTEQLVSGLKVLGQEFNSMQFLKVTSSGSFTKVLCPTFGNVASDFEIVLHCVHCV